MKTFRIFSDNLDETVFEHRNKEYGAYELRKSYTSRIIRSFLFSLSLITFLFGGPVLFQHLFSKKINPVPDIFVSLPIKLDKKFDIEQKKIIIEPPAEQPQKNKTENTSLLVRPDSLLAKNEIKKDTLPLITSTTTGTDNGKTTVPDNGKTGTSSDQSTGTAPTASTETLGFASVDKVPQFSGGEPAMMAFLQKNIRYNQRAKEEKINGRIYASFIINSKGEVEAIKILRGLGYGLDEEVVRVLAAMPKWEPGYFRGKPVNTIMNIPVSFSLLQ